MCRACSRTAVVEPWSTCAGASAGQTLPTAALLVGSLPCCVGRRNISFVTRALHSRSPHSRSPCAGASDSRRALCRRSARRKVDCERGRGREDFRRYSRRRGRGVGRGRARGRCGRCSVGHRHRRRCSARRRARRPRGGLRAGWSRGGASPATASGRRRARSVPVVSTKAAARWAPELRHRTVRPSQATRRTTPRRGARAQQNRVASSSLGTPPSGKSSSPGSASRRSSSSGASSWC